MTFKMDEKEERKTSTMRAKAISLQNKRQGKIKDGERDR